MLRVICVEVEALSPEASDTVTAQRRISPGEAAKEDSARLAEDPIVPPVLRFVQM